jgi:ubiquinone/menaquinone biosynthesis C-methylase UbiE
MMPQSGHSWQAIWRERRLAPSGGAELMQQLIDLDGFDSLTGRFASTDWRAMAAHVISRTGLRAHDQVLEVGSGAGAFLLALSEELGCRCVGVDLSMPLIRLGSHLVDSISFVGGDALHLPIASDSFSAVFAHSVFQYLESPNSALIALEEMHRVAKTGGIVCVLDINDRALESEFHEIRSAHWPDREQYWAAFNALPQLFLDRSDLRSFIEQLGVRDVAFLDGPIPGYVNSSFRFGLYYRKTVSCGRPTK